jgi:hypothetical protein
MRRKATTFAAVVSVIAILYWCLPIAHCQQKPVTALPQAIDLGLFTKEISCYKIDGRELDIAIWMPSDFFVEATRQRYKIERRDAQKIMTYMKPYHVIFVQRQIEDIGGNKTYANDGEVRSIAYLQLTDGTKIRPCENIPPNVSVMMTATMSALASDGATANMRGLLFPAKVSGQSLIDTTQRSKLTLILGANGGFHQQTVVWHTPFDAISPAPPCIHCGESVTSKWIYCPWCGNQLVQKTKK